jgi:hypothetical protein
MSDLMVSFGPLLKLSAAIACSAQTWHSNAWVMYIIRQRVNACSIVRVFCDYPSEPLKPSFYLKLFMLDDVVQQESYVRPVRSALSRGGSLHHSHICSQVCQRGARHESPRQKQRAAVWCIRL